MSPTIYVPFAIAVTLGAALPIRAQTGASKAVESSALAQDTAKVGGPATRTSAGHTRGLLGHATAAAAGAAKSAMKSERKRDAAEAALVAVGKANPGTLMLHEVLRMQERDHAQAAAAQAARQAHATAAMATATAQMSVGMAAIAEQVQSTSQPSIAAQGGSVQGDSTLAAARRQYTSLVARAASGDRRAADQLARFQREMSAAAPTLNALPASQQQAAYDVALRDALACATSGAACRTR